MAEEKYQFCSHVPSDCPPAVASPVNGWVYLGVKKPPIAQKDLLSYKEQNKQFMPEEECECSGMSVWVEPEAVSHAETALPHSRKWQIVRGVLAEDDGVIQCTPSAAQPRHHTFWRDARANIIPKLSIWREPLIIRNQR